MGLTVSWSGYCKYDGKKAEHLIKKKSGMVCPETEKLWAL
jgi:hypothetical protein